MKAVINYPNKDVFDGYVAIRNGELLREKGVYRFNNGDVAEGHFSDNVEGRLEGSYQYKWRSGEERGF